MKNIDLGKSGILGSSMAIGCMRIAKLSEVKIKELIQTALDHNINFFDHADIYAKGESEKLFGKVLKDMNVNRKDIIIQTKCGIRPDKAMFDFSKEHIIKSVKDSLKRLQTDYIDILLLHRPDTLVDPFEVADAFNYLKDKGMVKYFGVSNHTPNQITLLQKYLKDKLIINQLQFSIMHTKMLDFGLNLNMNNDLGINRDLGILEYCRLEDITIQAWSPFQYGFFEGVFVDNEKFPLLNEKLDEIAKEYNVSKNAIAVAWILRHPANMQVIVGTTNTNRLKEMAQGSDISLTREQWYAIYKAAGNVLP